VLEGSSCNNYFSEEARQGRRKSQAVEFYQFFKGLSKIAHQKLKTHPDDTQGVLEYEITQAEIEDILQRIKNGERDSRYLMEAAMRS
jgi:hypothetical protein